MCHQSSCRIISLLVRNSYHQQAYRSFRFRTRSLCCRSFYISVDPLDACYMAAQDSIVPDLTSDNFDLLRFPSLTGSPHELPADNDDLNLIARLGSFFDPTAKPATPSISPLSSTGDTMQQTQHVSQQMQQQIQPQSASLQLLHTPPRAQQPMPFSANSPGYPMLSPRITAPNAVQMMAARPPMMVCILLFLTLRNISSTG